MIKKLLTRSRGSVLVFSLSSHDSSSLVFNLFKDTPVHLEVNWVSGKPPVGFLLNQNGFVLGKEMNELPEVVDVSERCGKKRRITSRTVSTKSLPQCVCFHYPTRALKNHYTVGVFVHSCMVT
jgi:hypothetical protein